ncbi:MAG TPA: rhodanese-like domain-containing protein [Clostridia bacterium]|nr:rhodanese-like domain-containing protein [Clostridia bacterium]
MDQLDRDKVFILDVRPPEKTSTGSIEGSVNIPLNDLRARFDELPRDKEIIVYCKVGLGVYTAYRMLVQKGFRNLKNLSGGYRLYQAVKQAEEALK